MSEGDPVERVIRVGAVAGGILLLAVVSVAFDQGFGGGAAPVPASDDETETARFDLFASRAGEERARPPEQVGESGFALIGWRRTGGGMTAGQLGIYRSEAECETALRRKGPFTRYKDLSCAHTG